MLLNVESNIVLDMSDDGIVGVVLKCKLTSVLLHAKTSQENLATETNYIALMSPKGKITI